ncbi:MAG TPA: sigma-70 family RNA polymerase sigma factor [Gammaproteobacteria bacterium]
MTEPAAWSLFNQKLRVYIGRRVDAASVDDILGDILLRVVEHRDQFDSADNPLAWLYRVAGNIITDHYRRRAVERKALEQAGIDVTEADTDESDSYAELAQCLRPLIRQLPKDYGDALLLTDINGNTQGAVARELGLSVSGMKSRVQRGREQLKQALRRCCEIEVNKRGRIVDHAQRAEGAGCADPCGKNCGPHQT